MAWRDKLERDLAPKVVPIPAKMQKTHGVGTILVPTPMLVDTLVKEVKKGELLTIPQLRQILAGRFQADVTCPLTTGICLRICAETAEEDKATGRQEISPYWRVVRADGTLNPKFPGGLQAQARYMEAEGHKITYHPGKKLATVEGFQNHLARLR